MEDGVKELLNFAADTEALRDSLADVDLSSPQESSKEGATNNFTAAREPVLPHASAGPEAAKVPPVTRNKIWDEDAVGNDDTSEVRRVVVSVSLCRVYICRRPFSRP